MAASTASSPRSPVSSNPSLPRWSKGSSLLIAHAKVLRATNDNLRRDLAAAEARNQVLSERVAEAKRRLDALVARLPESAYERQRQRLGRTNGDARRLAPWSRLQGGVQGGRGARSSATRSRSSRTGCGRFVKTARSSSVERVAVMAALNLAHDFQRAAVRHRVSHPAVPQSPDTAALDTAEIASLRRRIAGMQSAIDQILPAKEKLF